MNSVKIAWGYGLVVVIYLSMLLLVDTRKGFYDLLSLALTQLPLIAGFALMSYVLRYLRWFLLLRWAGAATPLWRGGLAYVAGFAFTATPGKVGELIRIRYFARLNVDASRVMSAFVLEKTLDLIVVFCLASLWVADSDMFSVAATFVALLIFGIILAVLRPLWLMGIGQLLMAKGWQRIGRLFQFLSGAMAGCKVWIKPGRLLVSLMLGGGAWFITALGFVALLSALRLEVPLLAAVATYPLAMLAGAASMLPGGVGSTEAAIVLQLQWHGVPVSTALLVALVVRLGTMWFSVLLGMVAVLVQELQLSREAMN